MSLPNNRELCYDCELLSLDFDGLGSINQERIRTRKRIFCTHCASHPRFWRANLCLQRGLPINQMNLVEFAFYQICWTPGQYGRPLKVKDLREINFEENSWCDDCYARTFDEYPFFEAELGHLVFYYRLCPRCTWRVVHLQNGH